VHECDAPVEHSVHLPPDEAVVAALLPVRSKFTRKAAKKAAGGGGGGAGAALWESLGDAQQGALSQLAVYYLRLDPGGEWLGRLALLQPEHMWGLQLRSKDVVEQSLAVEGGLLAGHGGEGQGGGGWGGGRSCSDLLLVAAGCWMLGWETGVGGWGEGTRLRLDLQLIAWHCPAPHHLDACALCVRRPGRHPAPACQPQRTAAPGGLSAQPRRVLPRAL
jgi:hypothetical protein